MAIRSFPNIFDLSPNSEQAYKTYTVRYSQPQSPLGTTNGSFVGYRRVTASQAGNGKTVYTYSMPAAWHVENDIPITYSTGVCDPAVDGHCDGLYHLTPVQDLFSTGYSANLNASNYDFSYNPAAPNTMPFPENPNYDWQRGHLLTEKIFNNSDIPVKETLYTYGNYFPDEQPSPVNVYGYKIASHYPLLATGEFPAAHVFRISKYPVLTEVAKVLKAKKETIFSTVDINKKLSSEIFYHYQNATLNQATTTTFNDSQGRSVTKINAFPNDLAGGELGQDVLLQEHIHAVPLRQITKINNAATDKTEAAYVISNGKVVPGTLISYADGSTVSSRIYHEYDEEANLKQTTPVLFEDANGTALVSGISTSYRWGHNETLPIAKIENAKATDVYYMGFEEGEGNSATDDCRTGHKSRTNGFSTTLGASGTTSLADGSYILSYWKKSSDEWIPHQETVSLTGGTYQITIPSTEQIDDVRFYPASALMTTYTYDPGIGMTSMTDPNNRTTYYEYDKSNRLILIRDDRRNVVKTYKYKFKE